ncbi:AraC family transcriptional regulator [Asanoa ishikariensis]|uniref:AraC-type DNA-binding protein n=1 Tax=Asanoa ishikariensis TaxID=137265 RepID=A0A1H3TI89_9ACTN|nr:AraC family transcriptional regulator [Asanoa ishikariensis]GIF62445.1 AraC family transcriptional regulator [Asanoa ishikariensis]SDZ49588.1 AraC-type DNA-binding protein [Asanoa ishikariensis]
MDVLSDVVAILRTGRPRSARVAFAAPWAQEFAPVPGAAGFQVILRGSCWLVPPAGPPVPLAEGDVLFRPHGRGHVLADHPDSRPLGPACDALGPYPARSVVDVAEPAVVTLCGAYELDPARTHPLLHDLPEVVHLPGERSELRACVDLLAAELDRPRLGTDAIVPALLDTLLLLILRACLDTAVADTPARGWSAALSDPVVATAIQAVHRSPQTQWTVAGLAAEAGLSRAPFAARFARLVGQPPLRYLTCWRMTLAAGLLRDGDAPLAEIAATVGYGSEFAFAAAFKRQFGAAPGRWRRTA